LDTTSHFASLRENGDEGGKKDGGATNDVAMPQAKSQNISPVVLIRDPVRAGVLEKTSSQERRMRGPKGVLLALRFGLSKPGEK
jgi:hypothetical protein